MSKWLIAYLVLQYIGFGILSYIIMAYLNKHKKLPSDLEFDEDTRSVVLGVITLFWPVFWLLCFFTIVLPKVLEGMAAFIDSFIK